MYLFRGSKRNILGNSFDFINNNMSGDAGGGVGGGYNFFLIPALVLEGVVTFSFNQLPATLYLCCKLTTRFTRDILAISLLHRDNVHVHGTA